jgi:agmatinase
MGLIMTENPFQSTPTTAFLGASVSQNAQDVTTPYAFLGIPFGPPYEPSDLYVCAAAADAVRDSSVRMEYHLLGEHYDFDLGGPLFPEGEPHVTDCGDIVGDVRDPDGIWDRAGSVVRDLVSKGCVPLVVGGLDAIPPIVVGAFEGVETVNVLHVDAHLDFRHEVGGVTRGYSSPIRRIRELPCVDKIVQVGMRSVGSARPQDVADATAAGNRIVTAWELREVGAAALVASLPTDRRWVVTIDCDGLDPTIAPAVGWPEPGGLSFPEIATLVRGLASRNLVAGLVMTEFQPAKDVQGVTALTIVRLMINVMGLQRMPAPR